MGVLSSNFHHTVAAVYGEGAYGGSTYGCNPGDTACLTGDSLTDAGVWVIGIATAACLLVFAALVTTIWRRRKRRVHFIAHAYRRPK